MAVRPRNSRPPTLSWLWSYPSLSHIKKRKKNLAVATPKATNTREGEEKGFFSCLGKEKEGGGGSFLRKKGAEDRALNPCLVSLLERRNGHTGIKKETDIAPTTPTGRTDGREREGRAQLTVRNQFPVLAVVVVYVGKKSSEGGGEKN